MIRIARDPNSPHRDGKNGKPKSGQVTRVPEKKHNS